MGNPSEVKARNLKLMWVWALLAVLLSYNYDFECLLETQGCQQLAVVQSTHEVVEASCVQPGLTPAVVALLATTTSYVVVPAPVLLQRPSRLWAALPAPEQPPLSVPLGLRAPPQA